jgi:hypothetical protein
MLVEEFNALMPELLRSEAVAAYFRALVHHGLPPETAPAPWWDVDADVALLVGLHKHGFNNYEAIRKDEELEPAFQVRVQLDIFRCPARAVLWCKLHSDSPQAHLLKFLSSHGVDCMATSL